MVALHPPWLQWQSAKLGLPSPSTSKTVKLGPKSVKTEANTPRVSALTKAIGGDCSREQAWGEVGRLQSVLMSSHSQE